MNERSRKLRTRGAVRTEALWGSIAVCVVLAVCAIGFAWARIEGTLAGYALSQAQSEHNELLREQRTLQLELATRRSTRKIEVDARKRLGLVEALPERIIVLPSEGATLPAEAQARSQP